MLGAEARPGAGQFVEAVGRHEVIELEGLSSGAMRAESSLEIIAMPLNCERSAAAAAERSTAQGARAGPAASLRLPSGLMPRQFLLRPQEQLLALLARHQLVLRHALLRIARGDALDDARACRGRGICAKASSRCGKVLPLPSGASTQALEIEIAVAGIGMCRGTACSSSAEYRRRGRAGHCRLRVRRRGRSIAAGRGCARDRPCS